MKTYMYGREMRGFGLVELMVALVLGLIVVGGAISVFASNRQAFRATEGLSRLQENARVGFEMMARDVRDAAGNPCSKNIPIVNVLTSATPNGWSDWSVGIRGYDGATALPAVAFGTAPLTRVAGTDALDLRSAGTGGTTVSSHVAPSAIINVVSNAGFANNDIVLMCSYSQGAIFQITNLPSGTRIQHNDGGGSSLNCSKNLGVPLDCSPANTANGPEFPQNSTLVRMVSVRWFIGNNDRGGRSLFRQNQNVNPPEEIVDGVTDMDLTYLVAGNANYVAVPGNWANVNAVRIALTTVSPERVGTDGQPLEREIVHYAALRNRNL